MNIENFTARELEEELERRSEVKSKKPEPLIDINWQLVTDSCKLYIERIALIRKGKMTSNGFFKLS